MKEKERAEDFSSLEWRLVLAYQNAMSEEIYIKESRISSLCTKRFLEGSIDLDSYLAEKSLLYFPGSINFDSRNEFAEALLYTGQPIEEIIRIIKHEDKHYKTAKEAGFENLKYGMQYVRNQEGETKVTSFHVAYSIPPTLDQNTVRAGLRKIIEAPGEKEMGIFDKQCLPDRSRPISL